jgi:predicted ATPase/DNA-binding winged helix-turn-helix (wHTH) protein
MPEELVLFEDFVFDRSAYELRRSGTVVSLQRRPFELLSLLIERRGKLVTREEILERVWGKGVFVDTENAINTAVLKLRRALGDNPEAPRFVLTVPSKGYRFIADVGRAAQEESERAESRLELVDHSDEMPVSPVVGREEELARLRGYFARASEGIRQIVFVTGEAGIGKTTIVRALLADLVSDRKVRIGQGQCIEQYGSGEPYMPLLEALVRLSQETGGEDVREILSRVAPTWLAQMPALLTDTERERLQNVTQGTTQQRMLREMAEALEELTAEVPMVLAFEDLHWSDFSTLELIAAVARRSATARLLIIATYRPVEVLANEHPLRGVKEELQLHRQCWELKLGLLNENDVAAYLSKRFAGQESYAQIATTIHQRTEGNPLFMVNVVDYLVETGGLINSRKIEAPPTIQELIERNLERLDTDEQQILEAASVAGVVFSAAAVAAALKRPVIDIETCCARLGRREQFINANGATNWPDGTVAASFRFLHGLYEQVIYNRIPAGWRADLHRRIAERAERAFGDGACEIAAELAHHYTQAGLKEQALLYWQQAGVRASERSANAEAISHFTTALQMLTGLPDTTERAARELKLHMLLGPALIAAKGNGSLEVERAYLVACELCERLNESHQLFPVLFNLRSFYLVRGEIMRAHELSKQLLNLAQTENDTDHLIEAHLALGNSSALLGILVPGRIQFEQALQLYDPKQHRSHISLYGLDPAVFCLARISWLLWHLGFPDQALQRIEETINLAKEVRHPQSLAVALLHASDIQYFRHEWRSAQLSAEEVAKLCAEHGFAGLLGQADTHAGQAVARRGYPEEGMAQVQKGLNAMQAAGGVLFQAYFLGSLARACGAAGRSGDGLKAVAEAHTIISKTGERLYESELWRLKGELLVQVNRLDLGDEAEECFLKAIEISRQQEAKAWELRSTTSLARLLRDTGRANEARKTLTEIYNWFTEGFDTGDLKDAKALLDELSA